MQKHLLPCRFTLLDTDDVKQGFKHTVEVLDLMFLDYPDYKHNTSLLEFVKFVVLVETRPPIIHSL